MKMISQEMRSFYESQERLRAPPVINSYTSAGAVKIVL